MPELPISHEPFKNKFVIWKYSIPSMPGAFELEAPIVSMPLSVQVQSEEPKLWMLVDPRSSLGTHKFFLAWTGMEFETRLDEVTMARNLIGTFQTANGLVWHLFEGCR